MHSYVQLVGPNHALQLFGVKLLGIDAQNGRKLLFTAAFFLLLFAISRTLRALAQHTGTHKSRTLAFWTRQGISLITFVLGAVGVLSIWFDNPTRLATGLGLVGAGLAFALQKVITSFAGYFVILRGDTFNVGDRITMGGVRGDVIALNFIQTVIMEMGDPSTAQAPASDIWVDARQYTGRIVTVSNSKIFDDPIYNYTRDFPYLWEEMHIPIAFNADRRRAESILLDAARRETVPIEELAEPTLKLLEERFYIKSADIAPQVYLRLTNSWVELTVRFLCRDHGIRDLKNRMAREILDNLDAAGISIATVTYNIVGLPPVQVETKRARP